MPHGRVFYLPAIPESLITNITHVTKYIKSLKKKSDIKSDIKRDSNVTFVTQTYTHLPHWPKVLTFQRAIFGALDVTLITLKSRFVIPPYGGDTFER